MGFRYSAMIFSVSVLFICFLALFLSKAFTYIDAEILKGLECMKKILLWGILLLYHAFYGGAEVLVLIEELEVLEG